MKLKDRVLLIAIVLVFCSLFVQAEGTETPPNDTVDIGFLLKLGGTVIPTGESCIVDRESIATQEKIISLSKTTPVFIMNQMLEFLTWEHKDIQSLEDFYSESAIALWRIQGIVDKGVVDVTDTPRAKNLIHLHDAPGVVTVTEYDLVAGEVLFEVYDKDWDQTFFANTILRQLDSPEDQVEYYIEHRRVIRIFGSWDAFDEETGENFPNRTYVIAETEVDLGCTTDGEEIWGGGICF